MKLSSTSAAAILAATAYAAPTSTIQRRDAQLGGLGGSSSGGLGGLGSLGGGSSSGLGGLGSLGGLGGSSGGSSGLGGLLGGLGGGSASGGIGSGLGGSSGSGSSSGGLGGLGGLGGSSGGLGGLGGLGGASGTGGFPPMSTGGLGGLLGGLGGAGGSGGSSGLGGLLGGLGGSSGGLGGLGGSSGGLGGLGSLGGLGGGSASGGIGSGLGGADSGSPSGSSGTGALGGLGGLTGGGGSGGLGGLTGGAGGLGSLLGGGESTDITDGAACKGSTLIFARGTGETGTLGNVVGPGLSTSLKQDLNNDLNIQGVDYPADAAGNANGGKGAGSDAMVALSKQALQKCPDTKIVLSGYSQGAMVVHAALSGGVDASKVGAVITFGDPLNGTPFAGVANEKIVQICGSGDFICTGRGGPTTGTGSHLSYGNELAPAAQKAAQILGGGAAPTSPTSSDAPVSTQ